MDIKVPAMGESVTEGTLANWLVKPGQAVKQDDPIAEIETDKVAIEVPAPAAGVITEQLVKEGETVSIGKIIAKMQEGGAASAAPAAAAPAAKPAVAAKPSASAAPAAPAAKATDKIAPSVGRIAAENGVNPADIPGTAKGGRATKGDALAYVASTPAPAPLTCFCDACDGRGYAAPPDLPALAELRAALAGRPDPDFAFDQGAIPPEESLLRAASMQDRGDLWGQEILFVGDFDLTSVALALTRQPARVVVLDIDPRVVAFVDAAGARLGLPLSGRLFDVRDPLPDDLRRRFDAFVCDPVETLPGIRLYLARGAAALRGEGSAAWIGLTTIEASRRKWYAIQQILASSGLVVTDLRRRFSGYPDHDDALVVEQIEQTHRLGHDAAHADIDG